MRLTYICIKLNKTSQLLAATYGRPLPHWRAELARAGAGALARAGRTACAAQPMLPQCLSYMYTKYILYMQPQLPLRLQPPVAPPCGGLLRGGHSLPLGRPAKTIASPIYEPPLWTPPQSMGGAFS